MGVSLVLVGALVCVGTILIALLRLPLEAPLVVVVGALVAVFVSGFLLTRRAYVVRLGEEGYQVRFVRGAGVKRGRWKDVEDAVTAEIAGSRCLVLRLRNGRSTIIPVELLAVDREE